MMWANKSNQGSESPAIAPTTGHHQITSHSRHTHDEQRWLPYLCTVYLGNIDGAFREYPADRFAFYVTRIPSTKLRATKYH